MPTLGRSPAGTPSSPERSQLLNGRPRRGATLRATPVDLTDSELATVAQACRAMAHQEGERAKSLENPTVRGPIEGATRRYIALANELEAERRPR